MQGNKKNPAPNERGGAGRRIGGVRGYEFTQHLTSRPHASFGHLDEWWRHLGTDVATGLAVTIGLEIELAFDFGLIEFWMIDEKK
jgi:hypothetical protein